MALEAEKRGEDFEDVLDMTPTEFCDELLYSIGGSKAPGGRYLLKGAGIYYQLTGILGTALFSLILLLALFYTIIIPVSYTHLDVYKRQVSAHSAIFFDKHIYIQKGCFFFYPNNIQPIYKWNHSDIKYQIKIR